MEDIDKHLFLANIEVSCWKDQLKQAVSQFCITITFYAVTLLFLSHPLFHVLYYCRGLQKQFLPLCRQAQYCFGQIKEEQP